MHVCIICLRDRVSPFGHEAAACSVGFSASILSNVHPSFLHRWPDIYIGLSTMGKNMSVGNILRAIDNATTDFLAKADSSVPSSSPSCSDQEIRTVTIELMTHPGYPSVPPVGGCGEGPDDFSQSWERLHELETLKNPELQSHYKTRNIQLCAFKDL